MICTDPVNRYARGEYEYDDTTADAAGGTCTDIDDPECQTQRPPLDMPLSRKSWIDFEHTDTAANPKVSHSIRADTANSRLQKVLNGVKMGEGDGTVSLLSLGAMCVDGWQRKKWNPAGIKVVTVEVSTHL